MIVEKIPHSGAWSISETIKNERLFTKTYYGYTKKEAISEFKHDKKMEENHHAT